VAVCGRLEHQNLLMVCTYGSRHSIKASATWKTPEGQRLDQSPETPADSLGSRSIIRHLFCATGREALSPIELRGWCAAVARAEHVARDAGGILRRGYPLLASVLAPIPPLLFGAGCLHPTGMAKGRRRFVIERSLAQSGPLGVVAGDAFVGDAPYNNRFGFTLLRSEGVMPPPTS